MRMKFLKILLCSLISLSVVAADPGISLLPKEKFHIFLLAGQSNMAGRGKIEAEDKVPHPRVLVLTQQGEWKSAVAPLHYDKTAAGVGLGCSFAIALTEQDPTVTIGLVPSACGGSSIEAWVPGGYHAQTKSHPYDDAVNRTQTAMAAGVLKGILWHQGESDASNERSAKHARQLRDLINRLRDEFNTPELPFIIGQLGQFAGKPWSKGRHQVDLAQRTVAKEVPHCAFVTSDGLTSNSDQIHFNTKSLHEFGRRYAEAYLLMH